MLRFSLVFTLVILTGCCAQDASSPEKHPELILYSGAGLRPPADAIIAAFEQRHNVTIHATYAGSARLLGQAATSKKGDLYMPGAQQYVDKAVERGLAFPDSRRVVAHFVPVIFVPEGNPAGIGSLDDFKRPGLRIGLGDEKACAVGGKALRILANAGIDYASIQDNVVLKAATVNELAVAVKMRNVDAAIVWGTTAWQFADAGDIISIPAAVNDISTVPIVVLKSSLNPQAAEFFIDFVTSEAGRSILSAHGYTLELEGVSQRHE